MAEALAGSYDRLVTGGLYRSQDLRTGHQLLQRAGLITVSDLRHLPTPTLQQLCALPDDVAAELLLHELLLQEPPLWLYAAVVDDEVRWENVPDADQNALRQLLADAARREALLLTTCGRARLPMRPRRPPAFTSVIMRLLTSLKISLVIFSPS